MIFTFRLPYKCSETIHHSIVTKIPNHTNLFNCTLANGMPKLAAITGERSIDKDNGNTKISLDLEEGQNVVRDIKKWAYACLTAEAVMTAK